MLDYLLPITRTAFKKKYTPGAAVFYQGEIPRHAGILLSGILKVYSISKDGEEQIVSMHIAGEFFPSSWIFGKSSSCLFFYEALTNCEVAFVDRTELIAFMMSDDSRVHAMLNYFTTNYSASLIRISALEQPKAKDKIVYTLYFLCTRYGKESNGKTIIPLSLTHQHIGNMVGLTRETVAIEMNNLKREKIISYTKQKYTVDVTKLLQIIGEDSFKEISIEQ